MRPPHEAHPSGLGWGSQGLLHQRSNGFRRDCRFLREIASAIRAAFLAAAVVVAAGAGRAAGVGGRIGRTLRGETAKVRAAILKCTYFAAYAARWTVIVQPTQTTVVVEKRTH
jgi:hypothetical protein